jgi:hypothetical protein
MDYVSMMIEKHRGDGLLLDANLLLLYLVGAVDPHSVGVGQYNGLSNFKMHQFVLLNQLIACFKRVVTTAHVLTEVSNLAGDMHETGRQRIFQSFAETLEVIDEQDVSSDKAARRQGIQYMGLTDSVRAELANRFLVVSNDGGMVKMTVAW